MAPGEISVKVEKERQRMIAFLFHKNEKQFFKRTGCFCSQSGLFIINIQFNKPCLIEKTKNSNNCICRLRMMMCVY